MSEFDIVVPSKQTIGGARTNRPALSQQFDVPVYRCSDRPGDEEILRT